MALGFAKAGAHVVVVGRTLDTCNEVVDEITATTGREAMAYACHVGHWDELEPLVDATYGRFGRLDVVVNNAGKSPLFDKLSDVDERLWDSVFSLNLKGPFRLSVIAGERMAAAGGGSIINISSAASRHPEPFVLPYAAAKAGLNTITAGLAHALGPSVRVNCIMAGPFFTDVSKHWDLDGFAKSAKSHALERGGDPAEIVGTALYFASDASSYTTGAVLAVEGGLPL
jgi:NAD(P)-dependent dehydrogenase (short-subunit alcohol dehydrogenase family)